MLRVFVVCLLSLISLAAGAAEPLRLRVLTYNIHHGEGVDGKLDLPRIARVILSVSPDLVALQEVDDGTQRTGQVKQLEELARLTKLQGTFGKNFDFQGGGYGNAVLSRFPLVTQRNVLLPRVGENEQRGVLIVTVQPTGFPRAITFASTHLDYQRDDTERLQGVAKLNELLADEKVGPALLAGDFNDTLGSRTLQQLQTAWQVTNDTEMPTTPVDKPKRQIDFVLCRPTARWKLVETKVLDEAVASDHRAVLAVLEYLPEPEPVMSWKATRTLTAPEARQAACADRQFLYAINNTNIARYDRATGELLAMSEGEAEHLNSGFLHEGRLYCAHSNYPKQPERSEIKVLDLQTMQLTTFKEFGNYGGSLTWVIQRDGHWWCNFARYGEFNRETFLVRFDGDWQETGRWTYPPQLLEQIGNYSLSGGVWRGEELLVTDHDHFVLYRLRLPVEGQVLEYLGRQSAPFSGQGMALDPVTGGLVGIHRGKTELILAEPTVP